MKLRTDLKKLEVGKSIQFTCEYPNKFRGYVTYFRDFYKGYDVKIGDELDELILKEVVARFASDQRFNVSQILLFENQLENFKTVTKGLLTKSTKLLFYPLADNIEDYVEMNKTGTLQFTEKKLTVTILSNEKDNLNTYIYDEYILAFDKSNYDLLNSFK